MWELQYWMFMSLKDFVHSVLCFFGLCWFIEELERDTSVLSHSSLVTRTELNVCNWISGHRKWWIIRYLLLPLLPSYQIWVGIAVLSVRWYGNCLWGHGTLKLSLRAVSVIPQHAEDLEQKYKPPPLPCLIDKSLAACIGLSVVGAFPFSSPHNREHKAVHFSDPLSVIPSGIAPKFWLKEVESELISIYYCSQ
jgi:hypothetical protein